MRTHTLSRSLALSCLLSRPQWHGIRILTFAHKSIQISAIRNFRFSCIIRSLLRQRLHRRAYRSVVTLHLHLYGAHSNFDGPTDRPIFFFLSFLCLVILRVAFHCFNIYWKGTTNATSFVNSYTFQICFFSAKWTLQNHANLFLQFVQQLGGFRHFCTQICQLAEKRPAFSRPFLFSFQVLKFSVWTCNIHLLIVFHRIFISLTCQR